MSRDQPSVSSTAQQMAFSAKEKWQGMVSSLKGMSLEDGMSTLSRLRNGVDEWENVVRTMFGSCTTGETGANAGFPDPFSTSEILSACGEDDEDTPMSPSQKKEEFFYSQFLATDHTRAAKAVHALRRHESAPLPSVNPPVTVIPKPFHVSSPSKRRENSTSVLVKEIVPPIHHADRPTQHGAAPSFDDGISAISAHTLEEMARTTQFAYGGLERMRSDLTSEGFETIDSSFDDSLQASPHQYSISRIGSKDSSKRTRSTESSETMEFENAWRKDEQQYWEDVVESDVVRPKQTLLPVPRSRSRDSDTLKHNQTITTAGSSNYSSISSPFAKHPHDVVRYDPRDVIRQEVCDEMFPVNPEEMLQVVHIGKNGHDPDRLEKVLVLEHETELGEI